MGMSVQQIREAWMPFLVKHRIPADDQYYGNPTPTMADLTTRAQYGNKMMNLRNLGVPELIWNDTNNSLFENRTQIEANLQELWDSIAPDIKNLTELGLIEKAYVYGFDEVPLETGSYV